MLVGVAGGAQAATAPTLGTADGFAVLAGSTVTNTGPTVVTGDLGVSPGSAITGFPPGIVNGTQHSADGVALQAQDDLTTAYDNAAGQACNTALTGVNLGGLVLTPGVYCFTSSAQLTGTLTLDAQGDSNAVFIFQTVSTLTTASGSVVKMINGGSTCNVFWKVGSSATLGTTTSFLGNILALTSITLTTGASLTGRALARNGATTLDSNTIDRTCAVAPDSTPGSTPGSTPSSTPGPATPGTVSVCQWGPVAGSVPNMRVDLKGRTSKKSVRVSIYRAQRRRGPTTLVAVRASRNHRWKAEAISLGARKFAFFYAVVGTSWSKRLRVPAAGQTRMMALDVTARGDISRSLRC